MDSQCVYYLLFETKFCVPPALTFKKLGFVPTLHLCVSFNSHNFRNGVFSLRMELSVLH